MLSLQAAALCPEITRSAHSTKPGQSVVTKTTTVIDKNGNAQNATTNAAWRGVDTRNGEAKSNNKSYSQYCYSAK